MTEEQLGSVGLRAEARAPSPTDGQALRPVFGGASKPTKPLGRKAYGSIPHLPGSRLGPADHSIHEGQDTICMVKARDKWDRIIVTEKLDGSNVAVANVEGQVLALTRSGYTAEASPYPQHHLFGLWLRQNAARFEFLRPGERVNGEWLALAHGTRYALPGEPFIAFDMMAEAKRLPWDETTARCGAAGVETVRVLSDGPPIHINQVLPLIETSGHGALEAVEGAVWRVERKGAFDFIAKWVRPDKQDGKYLTDITGHPEIWHWRPRDGDAPTGPSVGEGDCASAQKPTEQKAGSQ